MKEEWELGRNEIQNVRGAGKSCQFSYRNGSGATRPRITQCSRGPRLTNPPVPKPVYVVPQVLAVIFFLLQKALMGLDCPEETQSSEG